MNRHEKKRLIVLAAVLVTVIGLIGILIQSAYHMKAQPKAVKGVLELPEWDFSKDGPIRLDGEWEIYWDKLLTPDYFSKEHAPGEYYQVPKDWKSAGRTFGTATYHLKVVLGKDAEVVAIKTSVIRMANHIFVNSMDIGSSGTPALNKQSYGVNNVPYVAAFHVEGHVLDIVVQVSDYDYKVGGIVQSIYLGTSNDLVALNNFNSITTTFVAAGLLVGGLFYLLIYLGRRREIGILYYSIHIMMIAFFVTIYGDKILLQTFPGLPFILMLKLECLALYLSCVFMCLLVYEFTGRRLHPLFIKSVVIILGGYGVLYVLLPISFISRYENFFLFMCLFLYAFHILYLIKLIVKNQCGPFGRVNAILLAAAFLSVLVFLPNGILFVNNMTSSNYIGSLGYVFYVGIMSTMISRQYNEAIHLTEAMNEELLIYDRMKDDFLTSTAHELRAPLIGIHNIVNAYVIRQDVPIEEKEDLAMVVLACRRLTGMVDEMQDLTSIKQGILRVEPSCVDIHIISSIVMRMLEAGEGKSRFVNRLPVELAPVWADEERVRQIFFGLLGILLKSTEDGTVFISGSSKEDKVAIVFGVKSGKQDGALWNQLHNLESDTQEYRNLSQEQISYTVAVKLAELQNGSIQILGREQDENGFLLTLPACKGEGCPSNSLDLEKDSIQYSELLESPNRNFRILVADDDVDALRELELLLSADGYQITAVRDGAAAVKELWNQSQYDLVILDILMPYKTGLDVLADIRGRFTSVELPVLILTNRNRTEDIRLGYQAGANDYLFKPYNADELRARVGTMLQLKSTVNNLVSAEMMFLQAQIKPHFLYNALSVISALSTREPQRSKELLLNLADYLRGSFQFDNENGMVRLETELRTVQAYLEIEKARFRERLKVEYDIRVDSSIEIPLLTIQPLVENGVRHGILTKVEGGTLIIHVDETEDALKICIEDDGVGMTEDQIQDILSGKQIKGVGLWNIHRRLLALYGKGLSIESSPSAGTKVYLDIMKTRENKP